MPPVFNGDKNTLNLSVGDLIRSDPIHPDIDRLNSVNRSKIGRFIHSQRVEHQAFRHPSYESEVQVASTLTLDKIRINLRGRIDGIYTDEKGNVVIEEIKSVAKLPVDIPPPHFIKQCQVYAWMYQTGRL